MNVKVEKHNVLKEQFKIKLEIEINLGWKININQLLNEDLHSIVSNMIYFLN